MQLAEQVDVRLRRAAQRRQVVADDHRVDPTEQPLPRTILRFAGGREITLGDLGARQGLLGGVNAVIVGNYLTTLGRPAEADIDLLGELQMPIKALNATL